jgi:hypothetical protein
MPRSIESVLNKLEYFFQSSDCKGWDPYDGLNSKFLNALTFGLKWPRIAVIQSMKRSRVNLRPLFGIGKARNPKALGLIARAYILQYKITGNEEYLDKARKLLDWLITHNTGASGYAWGYNFNWQSRIFYLPMGMPTVVNTCFIGHAFLDAYMATREKSYFEICRSCCDFILNDLNRTPLQALAKGMEQRAKGKEQREKNKLEDTMPKSGFCFSYTPTDKSCVHNANLLAAGLLVRVGTKTRENELLDAARNALEFTLHFQNPDGSWFYGINKDEQYIDNFHTGFVLTSLKNIGMLLEQSDSDQFKQILNHGYEYYKNTFWDEHGQPKYYSDKKYPVDLHCSAQGIITFLKFRDYDRANKIARWAIENMWDDKKGYFYFQRTKKSINKIPYLRWPNTWMYLALTRLLRQRAKG